jgi:hypothetical protein
MRRSIRRSFMVGFAIELLWDRFPDAEERRRRERDTAADVVLHTDRRAGNRRIADTLETTASAPMMGTASNGITSRGSPNTGAVD